MVAPPSPSPVGTDACFPRLLASVKEILTDEAFPNADFDETESSNRCGQDKRIAVVRDVGYDRGNNF